VIGGRYVARKDLTPRFGLLPQKTEPRSKEAAGFGFFDYCGDNSSRGFVFWITAEDNSSRSRLFFPPAGSGQTGKSRAQKQDGGGFGDRGGRIGTNGRRRGSYQIGGYIVMSGAIPYN